MFSVLSLSPHHSPRKENVKEILLTFRKLSNLTGQVNINGRWNVFFSAAPKVRITKPARTTTTTTTRLQLGKAKDGILGGWLRHFREEPRPWRRCCYRHSHSNKSAGGRAAAQTPHCACFWLGWLFSGQSGVWWWIVKGRLFARGNDVFFCPLEVYLFFPPPKRFHFEAERCFHLPNRWAANKEKLSGAEAWSSTPSLSRYMRAGWQSALTFTSPTR